MRLNMIKRAVVAGIAVLTFSAVTAPEAAAQGFISPIIGYNFGGDSGCPEIDDCEDKKLNLGVAFGAFGPVLGFETEIAFINNFFGETPLAESDVMTLMANVMLAPKIGPVRPYGVIGFGLIKTSVEFTAANLLDVDNNDFGWNLGGGIMVLFGEHVGVRGDIRYFHTFSDLDILGFEIGGTKMDFGRAAAGVVFAF